MTNSNSPAPVSARVSFSNKAYDVLKFIALIALPALAVLYAAVAAIWGLPKATEVVGTITAVDLFLGALLGISTSNYKRNASSNSDGALVVNENDAEAEPYRLEFEAPLEDLAKKDTITLKVRGKDQV